MVWKCQKKLADGDGFLVDLQATRIQGREFGLSKIFVTHTGVGTI
jgi:hypothetical protein